MKIYTYLHFSKFPLAFGYALAVCLILKYHEIINQVLCVGKVVKTHKPF